MTVTDRSPKRFCFTPVSRLQNYALDVIEKLIMVNETFVSAGDMRSAAGCGLHWHERLIVLSRAPGYIPGCLPHKKVVSFRHNLLKSRPQNCNIVS